MDRSIASPKSEFSTTSTPLAAGRLQHLCGEVEGAGVEHPRGAELSQQLPLRRAAGGGEHRRPPRRGDLERREPHAPRAPVDEDRLPLRQMRKLHQPVPGGEEGGGDGGRRGQVHALGQGGDGVLMHRHMGREAGRREGDHPVAGLEPRAARPGARDHARAFHADGGAGETVLQRLLGQEALRPHHVPEVEPGGDDLDLHLLGLGPRARLHPPFQRVDGPLLREREPPHPLAVKLGGAGAVGQVGGPLHPHAGAAGAVMHRLAVLGRMQQFGRDPGREIPLRDVDREVREAQVQLRVLVGEHAPEAPDRRLRRDQRAQRPRGHRASRHDPQPREPLGRRQRPPSPTGSARGPRPARARRRRDPPAARPPPSPPRPAPPQAPPPSWTARIAPPRSAARRCPPPAAPHSRHAQPERLRPHAAQPPPARGRTWRPAAANPSNPRCPAAARRAPRSRPPPARRTIRRRPAGARPEGSAPACRPTTRPLRPRSDPKPAPALPRPPRARRRARAAGAGPRSAAGFSRCSASPSRIRS